VIAEPEVVGIEKIGVDGVIFRVTARTAPGQQFRVQRALITALSQGFDEEGLPRTGVAAAPPASPTPGAGG
jgi:small conductance mechanosensitive channel